MKNKFKNAFDGTKMILSDRSILIQFVLAILTIIVGYILKLTYVEWFAVILCIIIVICLEIMNTIIEKLCDLYSTEYDERIKTIKDMSAGMVLISCIGAVIVATMILIRRLM